MPKTILNIAIEMIGNSSMIALLPHGREINKKGNEQSEIAPSRVTNPPNVFPDDFLTAVPITSKENATKKKKIRETKV